LVRVVVLAIFSGEIGGFQAGLTQCLDALHHRAIPNVDGQHEEDATDDREAEDVVNGAEFLAKVVLLGECDERNGQAESQR
jgi:hypothetical protein